MWALPLKTIFNSFFLIVFFIKFIGEPWSQRFSSCRCCSLSPYQYFLIIGYRWDWVYRNNFFYSRMQKVNLNPNRNSNPCSGSLRSGNKNHYSLSHLQAMNQKMETQSKATVNFLKELVLILSFRNNKGAFKRKCLKWWSMASSELRIPELTMHQGFKRKKLKMYNFHWSRKS